MKEQIRNRITVAKVMTQTRLGHNINPDKRFTRKVGSRALYYRAEKLVIQADGKKNPQAQFSRLDLGNGAFVWCPTNKAGEDFLKSLTDDQRDDFLYHAPPPPTPVKDKAESRRIESCNPVKALPKGHRESDYFPDDSTILTTRRKPKVTTVDSRPAVEPTEANIDAIRAAISAGKF